MSRRVGSTAQRAVLIALAIAITTLASTTTAAIAETTPILYLRGTSDAGHYNFTTIPPQDAIATAVPPFDVRPASTAEWIWRMNRAPQPWTLTANTQIQLTLHLTDLHETLPLPRLPPDQGDEPLTLRLEAHLYRGGTHDQVASGHTTIHHDPLTPNTIYTITTTLTTPQDAHFDTQPGTAPDLGLHIQLHGLARRDAPPHILTESTATPSQLNIPGFPIQAYHGWEQTEHGHEDCRKLLLEQRACEDGATQVQDAAEIHEATGVATLLLGVGLILLERGRKRGGRAAVTA